jgi:hypothetical protein
VNRTFVAVASLLDVTAARDFTSSSRSTPWSSVTGRWATGRSSTLADDDEAFVARRAKRLEIG